MNDKRDDGERHNTMLQAEPLPDAPPILIVEQEPAVEEMLCWMLLLAGYRAMVCANRDAVFTWGEQIIPADDPMLILLDLSLLCAAEVIDFLARLRAKWQEAGKILPPIIVLTTSLQVRAELRFRECILQKPFRVHDLLCLIQALAPALITSAYCAAASL